MHQLTPISWAKTFLRHLFANTSDNMISPLLPPDTSNHPTEAKEQQLTLEKER